MKDSKGLRIAITVSLVICCLPVFVLCVIVSFFESIVEWVKDLVYVFNDLIEDLAKWCNEPNEELESEENVVLDEEEIEEP